MHCAFFQQYCLSQERTSAACAARPCVVRQHCFGRVFQCSCLVTRQRENVSSSQRSAAFLAVSACAAPGFCFRGLGPQLCHVEILQHNVLPVIPKDVPLATKATRLKTSTSKRKLISSIRLCYAALSCSFRGLCSLPTFVRSPEGAVVLLLLLLVLLLLLLLVLYILFALQNIYQSKFHHEPPPSFSRVRDYTFLPHLLNVNKPVKHMTIAEIAESTLGQIGDSRISKLTQSIDELRQAENYDHQMQKIIDRCKASHVPPTVETALLGAASCDAKPNGAGLPNKTDHATDTDNSPLSPTIPSGAPPRGGQPQGGRRNTTLNRAT